jgi:hypothetical protein
VVSNLGWKKTRLSLIETGRVRLDQEDASTLADTYRLQRRDRVALLELTELAGIRSLADELAWVTSHKFRKATATILDEAGHSARQVADQLGHSRTSTTVDDYIGRKVRNPAAAKALDDALRSLREDGQKRRRTTRSCCAWMRSRRFKPWTGPRRCCRCSRGSPSGRTHDYVRHGTSTLFAALEIATGNVTGACKPRHRHQEFLAFLKQVARAYPDDGSGTELHLVMDNYATHKRVEVRDWLAANPGVRSISPPPRDPS